MNGSDLIVAAARALITAAIRCAPRFERASSTAVWNMGTVIDQMMSETSWSLPPIQRKTVARLRLIALLTALLH